MTESQAIREAAETTLDNAKSLISMQVNPRDYESKSDECNDMASALTTVIDLYESQMDALRKEKRSLDDKLADLKAAQRPYENLKRDLQNYAKRLKNRFWDAKREMETRSIPPNA
jgi:peptidoglycan hydrolase CwlO-like protein